MSAILSLKTPRVDKALFNIVLVDVGGGSDGDECPVIIDGGKLAKARSGRFPLKFNDPQ